MYLAVCILGHILYAVLTSILNSINLANIGDPDDMLQKLAPHHGSQCLTLDLQRLNQEILKPVNPKFCAMNHKTFGF